MPHRLDSTKKSDRSPNESEPSKDSLSNKQEPEAEDNRIELRKAKEKELNQRMKNYLNLNG